jgi:hypothetical protein
MGTCLWVHFSTIKFEIESGHDTFGSTVIELSESLTETGPMEMHIMWAFTDLNAFLDFFPTLN